MDIKLSKHAKDILTERSIPEEWVWQAVHNADFQSKGKDENIHYFKIIDKFERRVLHVVVNPHIKPQKVVTVFFDRRERTKK